MKRAARPIDEAAHAILFRLRRVICKVVQFLEPERVFLGLVVVEPAGVQNLIEWHARHAGFDELRVGIERADDFSRGVELFECRCIDFVQNDDIGELDLIDEKVGDCAVVFFA